MTTPAPQHEDVPTRRARQLEAFYALQERFGAPPTLLAGPEVVGPICHRILTPPGSLEYLAALDPQIDLAAGIAGETPEERARQFLLAHWGLFSFFDDSPTRPAAERERDQRQFAARLFFKHRLASLMGAHCIFGWRIDGRESEELFVLHFDRSDRLTLVTAVSNEERVSDTQEYDAAAAALAAGGQQLHRQIEEDLKKRGVRGNVTISEQTRRDWANRNGALIPTVQVKYASQPAGAPAGASEEGRCLVIAPRPDAASASGYALEHLADYSTDVPAGPLGLTRVYGSFWAPQQEPDFDALGKDDAPKEQPFSLEELFEQGRDLAEAVLLDLESANELVGRYVAVSDTIMPEGFHPRPYLYLADQDRMRTRFDRQMAYYHVDLIQRHFRRLGLDALDGYPQLNPLKVVLQPGGRSLYNTELDQMHIQRLGEGCTHARDPRILYHEFVHAVTDALARLNRHDPAAAKDPRYHQMAQAAALDEGLADYFACSLAVRAGAANAHVYILRPNAANGGIDLAWRDGRRTLGKSRADGYQAYPYNLAIAADERAALKEDTFEPLAYRWGEHWARYLWDLRVQLGAEVADTVIAHAIFFLTRWASFGLAVLSLALADQLLFGGTHRREILDRGGPAKDWSDPVAPNTQPLAPNQPASGRPDLTDAEIAELRAFILSRMASGTSAADTPTGKPERPARRGKPDARTPPRAPTPDAPTGAPEAPPEDMARME